MIEIKVKKLHEDAVLPKSATSLDAGFDLVAIDDGEFISAHDSSKHEGFLQYRTGIAIEPPEGYHTEIFPRSSISKTSLVLANSVGLVDNGYRNEILCRFRLIDNNMVHYKKGDRIAQLVVRKTETAKFAWSDELSETDRGGGFGSTGT